jgi:hypothetical protein
MSHPLNQKQVQKIRTRARLSVTNVRTIPYSMPKATKVAPNTKKGRALKVRTNKQAIPQTHAAARASLPILLQCQRAKVPKDTKTPGDLALRAKTLFRIQ